MATVFFMLWAMSAEPTRIVIDERTAHLEGCPGAAGGVRLIASQLGDRSLQFGSHSCVSGVGRRAVKNVREVAEAHRKLLRIEARNGDEPRQGDVVRLGRIRSQIWRLGAYRGVTPDLLGSGFAADIDHLNGRARDLARWIGSPHGIDVDAPALWLFGSMYPPMAVTAFGELTGQACGKDNRTWSVWSVPEGVEVPAAAGKTVPFDELRASGEELAGMLGALIGPKLTVAVIAAIRAVFTD